MTLTLRIENVDALGNGMPTEFVLHRRGAIIGRAPTSDWCLPDPQRVISSRHCEVAFRDEAYWLTDVSTNGTYLNGSAERLPAEHQISDGDMLAIGPYAVRAELSGVADMAAVDRGPASGSETDPWDSPEAPQGPSSDDQWGDPQLSASPSERWQSQPPIEQSPDPSSPSSAGFEWGASPAPPVQAERGWNPTHDASATPHASSYWDAPEGEQQAASEWSSPAPDRPPPPSATDIWGQIAEDNVVDWARGGFGRSTESDDAPPSESADSLQFNSFSPPSAIPKQDARRSATRPPSTAKAAKSTAPRATTEEALASLVRAAGLDGATITGAPDAVLARAGSLLRSLVAGLYLLIEARARAKAQLGAESTRLEFNGNNPIKFARSPEQALAQLLNPAERGFMPADRATEDAFYDLQSHQMATLKAMQGALRATLDRFSPTAIRKLAVNDGVLARILPAARNAVLWQTYEREFSGVANGSDEAFMDVFAREFKKAYEEQSALARHSAER